jgi:hypothetical protein
MVTFLGLQSFQTHQHVTFLWGHLKSKVYAHYPHSIEELRERIHEEIAGICLEMLHHCMRNMHGILEEYLCRDGCYLKDIIFKK